MKLEFVIDKEYDAKHIIAMLSKGVWDEVEDRAKRMGFDLSLLREYILQILKKNKKRLRKKCKNWWMRLTKQYFLLWRGVRSCINNHGMRLLMNFRVQLPS